MSARVEEPPLESDGAHEKSPQAKPSESAEFPDEKAKSTLPDVEVTVLDEDEIEIKSNDNRSNFYTKYRPFILGGLAALILGWWISATILPETRHRW